MDTLHYKKNKRMEKIYLFMNMQDSLKIYHKRVWGMGLNFEGLKNNNVRKALNRIDVLCQQS